MSHIIIFHDGSEKQITSQVAEQLFNSGREVKNFTLEGNLISLSSIAKILTQEEYNEQYPHKRLEPEPQKFLASGIMKEPWNVAKHRGAMESLIRGYEKAKREMHKDWDGKDDLLYQKMLKRVKILPEKEQFVEAFGGGEDVEKQADEIWG